LKPIPRKWIENDKGNQLKFMLYDSGARHVDLESGTREYQERIDSAIAKHNNSLPGKSGTQSKPKAPRKPKATIPKKATDK
jgi:hypothetical protein